MTEAEKVEELRQRLCKPTRWLRICYKTASGYDAQDFRKDSPIIDEICVRGEVISAELFECIDGKIYNITQHHTI